MGRFDDWSLIDYIAGDMWHFYPEPNGNGAVAYDGNGALMSPKDAAEIFWALQCFFDFHGREKVQMLCDSQVEYMRTHSDTRVPSIMQHLYPEEYAEILAQRAEEKAGVAPLPRSDRSGFVYVVLADNGLCKIGRTTDFKRRLRALSPMLPYELETIAVIETEDMYKLEEELHNKFASKRKKGEWFELDDRDVECLKGLANE